MFIGITDQCLQGDHLICCGPLHQVLVGPAALWRVDCQTK